MFQKILCISVWMGIIGNAYGQDPEIEYIDPAPQIAYSRAQQKTDDSLTALIDEKLRSQYYHISNFRFGRAAFHSKNCNWGYLDEQFKEIIPAQFDWATDFSGPFAEVDYKIGKVLIDKKGVLVTPIAQSVGYWPTGDNYLLQCTNPDYSLLFNPKTGNISKSTYNSITALSPNIFKYQYGIRYGLLSATGQALTDPLYHQIETFVQNYPNNEAVQYFAVKKRERWGIIDQNGKELIACSYNKTQVLGNYPSFVAEDPKTGLWGIVDAQNKIILPFRYQYAQMTSMLSNEKLFCIWEDEQWSIYNHDGQRLVQYPNTTELHVLANKKILLKQHGAYYLLDDQAKIASNAYQDIQVLTGKFLLVLQENRYGLCDGNGVELIFPKYEQIQWLGNGNYVLASAKNGGDFYRLDVPQLTAQPYEWASWELDSFLLMGKKSSDEAAGIESGMYHLFEHRWMFQSKACKLQATNLSAQIAYNCSKWGLLNADGQEILPFEYDTMFQTKGSARNFSFVTMRKGKDWFVWEPNTQLSAALPALPYDLWTSDGQYQVLIGTVQDTVMPIYGLYQKSDAKAILPISYGVIEPLFDQYLRVSKPMGPGFYLYGVADTKGKEWLPMDFHYIAVVDDYIIASGYQINRYFNKQFQLLEWPEGYEMSYNSNDQYGLFRVLKNGLYGCVNMAGKIVIPAEYEMIKFEGGGVISCKKGLNKILMDRWGNWITCYRSKPFHLNRIF